MSKRHLRLGRHKDTGDSLIELAAAMALIIIFSAFALNTFLAAQTSNNDLNASVEATLAGNSLVQQQLSYGCATVTSSQTQNGGSISAASVYLPAGEVNSIPAIAGTTTTPGTASTVGGRCTYIPDNVDGNLSTPDYGARSTLSTTPSQTDCPVINGGATPTAANAALTPTNPTTIGYLSSTPWSCYYYGGYSYQARVINQWVGSDGDTTPSSANYSCTTGAAAPTPGGIETTAELVWYTHGIQFHRVFSSFNPIPNDVPSSYLSDSGALVVQTTQPIEMAVTYYPASGSTPPTNYDIVEYPSASGYAWFPYIPAPAQVSWAAYDPSSDAFAASSSTSITAGQITCKGPVS